MGKQLKLNKEMMIQSAILNKQLAYNKYRDIQINILQNTFISSADGKILVVYDYDEMRTKLKEAEYEFCKASAHLVELMSDIKGEINNE